METRQQSNSNWNTSKTIDLFSDLLDGTYVPPKVILYLGLICNLKCPYCYLPYKVKLEDEIQIQVILKKLMDMGAKKLEILGGEPFVYRSKLLDILRFAKENHIDIDSISTNGLIYDGTVIEAIKTTGIGTFQISLDCATSKTYQIVRAGNELNFHKVCENINKFVECGLPVRLSFVILKTNISEIRQFMELTNSFKVKKVNFGIFSPIGEGKGVWKWMLSQEEFDAVSSDIKALKVEYPHIEVVFNGVNEHKGDLCEAGTSEIAVFPNGNLYPCGLFTGLPNQKIGNIMSDVDSVKLKSIFKMETTNALKYHDRCVACKMSVGD